MAVVTLHVDHAQYDMGREVQCLNAIIKGDIPLQVIRTTGPDLVIGALASMAAYPYVLLRAAELRQASPPAAVPWTALCLCVTCHANHSMIYRCLLHTSCTVAWQCIINHAGCAFCKYTACMQYAFANCGLVMGGTSML